MSRRRSTGAPDSLDLLLDTICNIFGLLIFVAVIAAVLSRARTVMPTHVPTEVALPEALELPDTVAPITEIDELDIKIAQARQHLDDLTAAMDAWAPPDDGDPESQGDLQEHIAELSRAIKEEESRRMVEMRLPRRRAVAGRVPVQLVVTGDRLYVINDWHGWSALKHPQGERCRFWLTFNSLAVDVDNVRIVEHEPCFRAGGQDLERWIPLLPDGGIDLTTPRAPSLVDAALRVLDPRTHVASIKVTEDSFDTWAPVRSAVLNQRVPYDLAPLTLEPGLIFHDRIRSGTASAQ